MLEQHIKSALENARKQLKKACTISNECRLDMNELEVISHPKRVIQINIPIRMHN